MVALRQRCFANSSQKNQHNIEGRFKKILFDNPWYREDISSLVAEDEKGSIIGFLGVVPRPMKFNGETVWMAVSTQLMACPNAGKMAGIKLFKEFLDGPQSLAFGDLSNSGAVKMWSMANETVAKLYSLYWTRPLRPTSFIRQSLNLASISKFVLRLSEKTADCYLQSKPQSSYFVANTDYRSVDISAERLCALYQKFTRRHTLAPLYSEADLGWLISDMEAQIPADTKLRLREVSDTEEREVGWYLYSLERSGTAQVIQIGGNPRNMSQVLKTLWHDAYMDGAICVSGRVQPEYFPMLDDPAIHISRRGPWVCFGTNQEELKSTILMGDAWLTRMEGEWWMNF